MGVGAVAAVAAGVIGEMGVTEEIEKEVRRSSSKWRGRGRGAHPYDRPSGLKLQ